MALLCLLATYQTNYSEPVAGESMFWSTEKCVFVGYADSEGPDLPVDPRILIRAFAAPLTELKGTVKDGNKHCCH